MLCFGHLGRFGLLLCADFQFADLCGLSASGSHETVGMWGENEDRVSAKLLPLPVDCSRGYIVGSNVLGCDVLVWHGVCSPFCEESVRWGL